MNEDFKIIFEQLCNRSISVSEFIEDVCILGDVYEDILESMEKKFIAKDWGNLGVLIWSAFYLPHSSYTPLLCRIIDERIHDDLLEAVADAFFEIKDKRAIPSLVKGLGYSIPGDDDHHFNRKW